MLFIHERVLDQLRVTSVLTEMTIDAFGNLMRTVAIMDSTRASPVIMELLYFIQKSKPECFFLRISNFFLLDSFIHHFFLVFKIVW